MTPASFPPRESWSKEILLNDGAVSLSYDTRKWGEPETDRDGIMTLDRLGGDGVAAIIVERVGIPSEVAVDDVLEEIRKRHPEMEILCREKRTVNGQEVWCLRYSLTENALPMLLYQYCYGGLAGTVQIKTCAGAASFDECEPDFTQLLNSLEVRPPTFPLFARMHQSLRFAGLVTVGAIPVLGIALIRFGTHMRWESALLWTAVLSLGVFVAGWLYDPFKFRLK